MRSRAASEIMGLIASAPIARPARMVVVIAAVAAAAATVGAQSRQEAAEFMQRRDRLAPNDVAGRMTLGRWAERRGLAMQAGALYHAVLQIDPDHDEAYERWVGIADTHRLPENDKRQKALKGLFEGMALHVTAHFIMLYDTDASWAMNRAAVLERTHHVFYTTLRRVGFKPWPLRERLVCLLFADHADYQAYARRHDAAEMGWAGGYYSTRTNRIAFYDERTSPQFEHLTDERDRMHKQVQAARAELDEALAKRNQALIMQARRALRAARKQRDWYRNRHNAVSKLGNATKTTHEAIHLLAYNSRLQRFGRMYPFWLSEGLATNFETSDPGRPFGPLHANEMRRVGLHQADERQTLLALNELAAVRQPQTNDIDRLGVMYSQSWALFGYLFRYDRQALRGYFRRIASMSPGPRSSAQLRQEFVDAFGPLDRLAKRFENHVQRLK